jgi:hypothetical protein
LVVVELGLGFPVRKEEIRRFCGSSRRVVRVADKQIDGRTFAEVVNMDVNMEPSRSFGQNNLEGNS